MATNWTRGSTQDDGSGLREVTMILDLFAQLEIFLSLEGLSFCRLTTLTQASE